MMSAFASANESDKAQIESVIESFSAFADRGAFDYLGRLMTDEVTVDYTSLFGGEPATVSNVELMRQWAGLLPGFDVTRHDLSNIRVNIKGDKATATSDITASHYLGKDGLGKDGFWRITGDYLFHLEKSAVGWQIRSVKLNFKEEKGDRSLLEKAMARAEQLAVKNLRLAGVPVPEINQKAAADARSINTASVWPKPENPVAPGSENSAALKVVQGFFEAYGKGDMKALRKFVADDIEWYIPGRHPLSGIKRGVDEFLAFFEQLGEAGFQAEVMIMAANDRYVVDAHRGWSTKAGENVDLNWVLLYQIENGKIRRVQNFSGDLYTSDQFFSRFLIK